ncbi:MAG: hypothetical protein GF401_10205 [Chitinivibrionales bacterium]|nr:hypothetical protein [Chitinivibrionales bacterium]
MMSNRGFDVEEAKARLQHLLSMPETPVRKREIAALRRSLELFGKQGPEKKRRSPGRAKTSRAMASRLQEPVDEPPKKPERETEKTENGHRRVIIRKRAPEKPLLQDERKDKREQKEMLRSIRSMIGSERHGMS